MRFGSLFAGIGGFDLGLERAGMAPAWQVEIDPFCRRVLAKHWPDVPRFEDVHHVGRHNLEAVDLICGGFPCQPHSLAGKRLGAEDDRDLWPEYRRIVGECRPRWVLAENVPGIRTTILDSVLSDLESLDYTTRTLAIPACAFDAPHRRTRIFIVAHTDRPIEGRREQQERGRDQRDADIAGHGPQENVTDFEQGRCNGHNGRRAEFQPAYLCTDAANAKGIRRQRGADTAGEAGWPGIESANGNVDESGLAQWEGESGDDGAQQQAVKRADWWAVEPNVVRVANGVPRRVDRLRALGNAVVPQVVEWIGRYIMEIDAA